MAIVAVGAAAIVLALVKIVVEVRDRSDPVDTAAIVKQFDEAEGGSDGNADGGRDQKGNPRPVQSRARVAPRPPRSRSGS